MASFALVSKFPPVYVIALMATRTQHGEFFIFIRLAGMACLTFQADMRSIQFEFGLCIVIKFP